MRAPITALFLSIAMAPYIAQAQGHAPYAGMETRAIKALSAQQIADLREGRGMGLALPAELNGYPGPVHVLEQADALQLSDAQRAGTRAIFETMRADARALGERLIEQESALDKLFASGTASDASLDAATSAIATTQAALRAAHLRAHIAQRALLSEEQAKRYAELRGYGATRRQ
jgi:Spy/CpxP family protein refolding chaperone